MAKTKQKAVPAKANGKADPKGKGKTPAPAVETEKSDRYLRAARVIVAVGETEGMDPIYLAMKAGMSQATASHCIAAFRGTCTALREAKLLPQRPVGAPLAPKAPKPAATRQAPEKAAVAAQKAEEPIPA